MEASPKENLAGVDVADTRNLPLVKEEVFETPLSSKERNKVWKGEVWRERIDTEPCLQDFPVFKEENFPKFPWIEEKKVLSRGEHKAYPLMPVGKVFPGHLKLPCHAKVEDEKASLSEGKKEVFPETL